MNLSQDQKRLIERVINTFETGTPDGNYSTISIFNDGPHNIRQITYGRSQTTEYGHLKELVQKYVDAGGTFSEDLRPFLGRIGNIPLTDNTDFKALLRNAAKQDQVMRDSQDEFFDEAYFAPAIKWADDRGFTLPLSALVIYDSFIHSGSILGVIRSKFAEKPPASGGDEKAWIKAYVNARHNWLANHPRKVVQGTVYRTKCFKNEIQRDNWDLSNVPINANGTNVSL